MSVSLRPIRPGDEGFLYQVYASTRADEMALLVEWNDAQKEQFLQFQFTAQHTYYQQQFAQAAYDLILLDDQPIGRLYVDRPGNEIHIIDIALLPDYRNRGIGSALLHNLLAEAARAGLVVHIYVEQVNPALRLYTRLGFHVIANQGIYLLMEWLPGTPPQPHDQALPETGEA